MASSAEAKTEEHVRKDQIAFHFEVAGASGIPKACQTLVQLGGFCFQEPVSSKPDDQESTEPGGWRFESYEEIVFRKAAKAEAEAAGPKTGKDKKKEQAQAPPPAAPDFPQPTTVFRFPQPCGSKEERQCLLNAVAGSPLTVALLQHHTDPPQLMGSAKLDLSPLIHQTSNVSAEVELVWAKQYLERLKDDYEGEAAAQQAANTAVVEDPDSPQEENVAEAATQNLAGHASSSFAEPASGILRVHVLVAAPLGQVLCCEDLYDWTVLTVQLDGLYKLPESLLSCGGPLPEGASGLIKDHPLDYSVRMLGCQFDGGQVFVPETTEKHTSAQQTPRAEGNMTDPEASLEVSPRLETTEPASMFDCEIGKEEFVEGLARAGFIAAHTDGPSVFEFLDSSGKTGTIGLQAFAQLNAIEELAGPQLLVALHKTLTIKYGDLTDAFNNLDSGGSDCLTLDSFRAALIDLGYSQESSDIDRIFRALDSQHSGRLRREDFMSIGLHAKVSSMTKASNLSQWLLQCFGSLEVLLKHMDPEHTGTLQGEDFVEKVQALGYQSSDDVAALFYFLNPVDTSHVSTTQLSLLVSLDPIAFQANLYSLEDFLLGSTHDHQAAFDRLCGETRSDMLGLEFAERLQALGYKSNIIDPRIIFAFLCNSKHLCISRTELSALSAFNATSKFGRIVAFKAFVDGLGGASAAFQKLFDDHTQTLLAAESKEPCIKWQRSVNSVYRGREWLQQFFNTIKDERGRNLTDMTKMLSGGVWLYFFPKLVGQGHPIDFKELTDPAQVAIARTARWHHAQAFLDLRRLAAPVGTDGGVPEIEFRAFLSQVPRQPDDVDAAGDLPPIPFGSARTYLKGIIRLDRELTRLSPRNISPLPQADGKPLIPPPPEKPLPLTVGQELELEARRIVARLASEFSRMCRDSGLEEVQGGSSLQAAEVHKVLGRATPRGAFKDWLREQDAGSIWKELSAELRPAIVRWVRSEVKDGPLCGLVGNEKDALYTTVCADIMKQLMRALNHDINFYKRQQDAKLWRSMPMPSNAKPPKPGETGVVSEEDRKHDVELHRLILEYSLLGDVSHAADLFRDRLALPQNIENPELWFEYSRFLMRCGQLQVKAGDALCHAISLMPATDGPSMQQTVFLACMISNRDLPCCLGPEASAETRFQAARSLILAYIDRHPLDKHCLYFAFFIFAVEAWRKQQEANEATQRAKGSIENASSAEPTVGPPNEAQRLAIETVQECEAQGMSLMAEAMKYLELARVPQDSFTGVLTSSCKPDFPELETLIHKEQISRGEIAEVPPCPASPPIHQTESQPAFPNAETAHAYPDAEDAVALDCIDMMLYLGVPNLVSFLINQTAADYGFLTASTVRSEKCQLQLVKAAMLRQAWDDAIMLIEALFAQSDRIPQAYVLLGECRYRATQDAKAQVSSKDYEAALAAYEMALRFIPNSNAMPSDKEAAQDPVMHLRIASIYFMRAEESGFKDEEAISKAVQYYSLSLQLLPTAEAWRKIGVCMYRRARLNSQAAKQGDASNGRGELLTRALRCLAEANLMDKRQPSTGIWLVMCAVETGQVQVAKQTFRQVMEFEHRLGTPLLLELAEFLVRFSDELQATAEERGRLVKNGRYAKETTAIATAVLAREESGMARYLLAQASVLNNDDAKAVQELCLAIPQLDSDQARQRNAIDTATACAGRLLGDPHAALQVQQVVQAVKNKT